MCLCKQILPMLSHFNALQFVHMGVTESVHVCVCVENSKNEIADS